MPVSARGGSANLCGGACCLLNGFALFYGELTSAGLPDPVTSLIPHHSPDWLSPAGLCFGGDVAVKGEPRADLTPSFLVAAAAEKR